MKAPPYLCREMWPCSPCLQPRQAEFSAVLQKMGSKDPPQRQNISSRKIWSTGLLQQEQSGLFLLEK